MYGCKNPKEVIRAVSRNYLTAFMNTLTDYSRLNDE